MSLTDLYNTVVGASGNVTNAVQQGVGLAQTGVGDVQSLIANPRSAITGIIFESDWTPVMDLSAVVNPPPGQPPGLLMKLIKPKVTVGLAAPLTGPVTWAPGGEPATKWPMVLGLGVIGGALLLFFAYRGLTCKA